MTLEPYPFRDMTEHLRRVSTPTMAERGYQDGKNIQYEVRYSEQDLQRLALNARELAASNVDLIWVPGSTVGAGSARGDDERFRSSSRLFRTR